MKAFKPCVWLKNPFTCAFTVAMVVLTLDFLVFWLGFGGCVNFDTERQWVQVQSGSYDDWHPFLHTILMMKLPSLLWSDYRVTVLWQMLGLAFAFGYLQKTLSLIGVRGWSWWLPLLVLVHPLTLLFAMMPLKDTAFACVILLLFPQLMRILLRCETFYRSPLHIMLTAVLLWLALSFRHNGIFFVVPALLFVLVIALKNRFWKSGFAIVLVLGIFQLVVTPAIRLGFQVKSASTHPREYLFLEACGAPLTMMGAVYVRHSTEVSPQVKELMNSIQPWSIWRDSYVDGSFNQVKHANRSYVLDDDIGKIKCPSLIDGICMFVETVRLDVGAAFKAFIALTGQVWNPFHVTRAQLQDGFMRIGISNPWIVQTTFLVSFFVFGFIALVFWSSAFFLVRGLLRRSWPELLLSAPIFFYDIGTMCLLSGFNEYRFFFFNVLVVVPMFLVLIVKERREPLR